MGERYLIGMDFGTSSLKLLLLDSRGRAWLEARKPIHTYSPWADWYEQEPEDWWMALKSLLREALAGADVRASDIAAVGISGHGCSCLPVDRKGRPLRRAIIWMDRRAAAELREVSRLGGPAIGGANGNPVMPFGLEPKLLWLKRNEPSLYAETHKFLTLSGFLNQRLTGSFTVDTADCGFFCAFDRHSFRWSEAVCRAIGIESRLYPDIYRCDALVGMVTRQAADETGLPQGTPVVAGSVDACSAAFGMGAVDDGQLYYSTGSGSNVGIPLAEPPGDLDLMVVPHVAGGGFLVNAGLGPTGACLDWYHNACSRDRGSPEPESGPVENRPAEDRYRLDPGCLVPGSGGTLFIPYMQGQLHPVLDPRVRGAFFGLSPSTSHGQMLQSIMEGCAFSLREGVEMLEQVAQCSAEIRIAGGPARNDAWNQIDADVTGRIIAVPQVVDCEPLADAILGGLGAGVFADYRQAVDLCVRIRRRFEPRPGAQARYNEMYEIYRSLLENGRSSFGALAEFRAESL